MNGNTSITTLITPVTPVSRIRQNENIPGAPRKKREKKTIIHCTFEDDTSDLIPYPEFSAYKIWKLWNNLDEIAQRFTLQHEDAWDVYAYIQGFKNRCCEIWDIMDVHLENAHPCTYTKIMTVVHEYPIHHPPSKRTPVNEAIHAITVFFEEYEDFLKTALSFACAHNINTLEKFLGYTF